MPCNQLALCIVCMVTSPNFILPAQIPYEVLSHVSNSHLLSLYFDVYGCIKLKLAKTKCLLVCLFVCFSVHPYPSTCMTCSSVASPHLKTEAVFQLFWSTLYSLTIFHPHPTHPQSVSVLSFKTVKNITSYHLHQKELCQAINLLSGLL